MSSISRQHVLTIIATFNRAHFLPDAIESVLAQDYSFKKIVVVDDGSTDETHELCKKWVEKYPDIVCYIYKDNGGCSSARNTGLAAIDDSIGYVCFLDSDDRFLPGKMTREVQLLSENTEADFTYSDALVFDTITGIEKLHRAAAAGQPSCFAVKLFITNEAKTSAIMYRRNVLENIRFREDFLYNEDTDFLQHIAMRHKAIYADQPGTWVRWHDGSKSRNIIEILKAVLKSKQEFILAYPAFYLENKKEIDAQSKRNRRHLAVELLLKNRFDEISQYTSDPFIILQASFRFPYIYKARRMFSNFINRHFK